MGSLEKGDKHCFEKQVKAFLLGRNQAGNRFPLHQVHPCAAWVIVAPPAIDGDAGRQREGHCCGVIHEHVFRYATGGQSLLRRDEVTVEGIHGHGVQLLLERCAIPLPGGIQRGYILADFYLHRHLIL
ncbi:MAG TPA: hypothetical protein VF043_39175 [Ktedonobacteraceae bacterium]